MVMLKGYYFLTSLVCQFLHSLGLLGRPGMISGNLPYLLYFGQPLLYFEELQNYMRLNKSVINNSCIFETNSLCQS